MWFGQSSLTTRRLARLFNPDGPVPSQSTLFSIFNPGYHVNAGCDADGLACLSPSFDHTTALLPGNSASVCFKKERKKKKILITVFGIGSEKLVWFGLDWCTKSVQICWKGAGTEWYWKINGDTSSQCGLWVWLRSRSRISEPYRVIVCLGKCQSVGKKMTYLETLRVL